MPSTQAPYPGELAKPDDILRLAGEYGKAAKCLLALGKRGDPLSRAPCRLAAIHAIELYLSALLLHLGHKASDIRGMQHDLAARTSLAMAGGLALRKRTVDHLSAMMGNREYVVARYGPEMTATVSQINRLMATLDEVESKVTGRIATFRCAASPKAA